MTNDSGPDTEYFLVVGRVQIGRLHRLYVVDALVQGRSLQTVKSLAMRSPPAPSFKPDVSYLLVGGLGGLHCAIISRMAAAEAGDFIVRPVQPVNPLRTKRLQTR